MVLGGLLGVFMIVYIVTWGVLRGRPRDFDSIMIDDFMANNDDSFAIGAKRKKV